MRFVVYNLLNSKQKRSMRSGKRFKRNSKMRYYFRPKKETINLLVQKLGVKPEEILAQIEKEQDFLRKRWG